MSSTDIYIHPYHKRSRGFRDLAKGLDLRYDKAVKFEKAVYESRESGSTLKKPKLLINWGCGTLPGWIAANTGTTLNKTSAVNLCRNKVKFFNAVGEKARVPVFTQSLEEAMKWVENGLSVMGRKSNGSCGTDIVFYEDDPAEFHKSEFWSQYKKKKSEFRVHIFKGSIIALQMKAVRVNDAQGNPIPADTIDFRIRNHRNGFIFKRNDLSVPDDVIEQAKLAFNSIPDLDFGAVDVIYNSYENKAYVLEINTAPGLEGETLTDYLKAFKGLTEA